ncbi:MAG: ATP-dependent sacrificial sulfur transferase LarE [Gracilibacteraceae bacterium]|jgi:uncharacterized protein|nr:ATP-dependent sacrificial sulfur transferase LarE [Gracilibacteraceae bacterium]
MNISSSLQTKYSLLRDNIAGMGSALVAYSGGVDSTFLLKTAHELLGDGVLAVTSRSPLHPEREQREAYDFCAAEKIPLIYCETDELALGGFAANRPDRCYLCRVCQFTQMWELANARGIRYVIEGTGADADSEHRHGFRVVAEKGVRSPLREAGLTKADVRVLARHIELPDWDKPSYSCLATRFPYGESVTREKLRMVDFAEQLLINLGFQQARVSIHGDIARIQLDTASFERFTESNVRDTIACALQGFGFTNVTLDLKEWRPPI